MVVREDPLVERLLVVKGVVQALTLDPHAFFQIAHGRAFETPRPEDQNCSGERLLLVEFLDPHAPV